MSEPSYTKPMGVDTKPAKRFSINGYWVLVDPNMPDNMFDSLKEAGEHISMWYNNRGHEIKEDKGE